MARVELEIHGDYKQAINGANELTSSMDKLNNETKQYNEGVKNAMNKAVNGSGKLSGEFRTQKGLIEDLEESIKDYEQKLRKATSTKDIEKYNRKIAEGKIHLEEYKKKGVPAIKEVNKQASVGTAVFKRLGGVIAAAFSIGVITRFINESLKAYDEQVKAEAALLTALKGRRNLQQRLIVQSKQLQSETLIGDSEILKAQTNLAKLLGANEDAIKRLTPLVLDLATTYKFSLQTASDLVAKSVGSGTNALSRYGIVIKGAVGSADRLESAISELNRVVGGQAAAAADVGTAALKRFSVEWTDLKEKIGAGIETVAEEPVGFFAKVLHSVNVFFDKLYEDYGGESPRKKVDLSGLLGLSREQAEKEFRKLEEDLARQNKLIESGWTELENAADETQQKLNYLFSKFKFSYRENPLLLNKTNLELKKLMEEGNLDAESELKRRREIFDEHSKKFHEDEELKMALAGIPSNLEKIYENAEDEFVDFIYKTGKYANPLDVDFLLPDEEEIEDGTDKLIKTYQKGVEKLKEEQEKLREWQQEHPIAVMFGIDEPEKLEAFNTMADLAKDAINSLTESWVENSQRVVDALNTRISEQQRAVEVEAQLAAEGKANNLSVKKAELEDLKKQRDRALKEQEKALKAQQAIETASQTINIMTAVTNILKEYTKIPLVGLLLGGAAIAALMTLFKSTKGKVADMTKYAEGGLLEGRPHSQGGVKVPELRAELEGGEYVVNKKMTQKHLPLLEAINKDKIEIDKTLVHKFKIEKSKVEIKETPEIREIRDMMRKIMSRTEVTYEGGYRIERFGNVRRRIG